MLSGFLQWRTDLSKDRYFSSHGTAQELGISCSATMCSSFQHWQPEGLEYRRGQLLLHTSFSRKLSEITGGWKDEINWSCPECAAKVIKHRKEVGWQNTWTPGKTHELLSEMVHLARSVGHERLLEAAARLFSSLCQLENGQSKALQEMALPIRY